MVGKTKLRSEISDPHVTMILLIQFRGDQSGPHEVKVIFDSVKKPYTDYRIINATPPETTQEELIELTRRASCVLIGGWGENGFEAATKEKQELMEQVRTKMKPVIDYLVQEDKPTLGMCLGHQIIADALGGKVVVDKEQAETGIGTIELTEEGKKDRLLGEFGPSFHAILGHKASVAQLPEGAVHLATTEKHGLQAFRLGNNVYGTQFHPELNLQELEERVEMYPEYRDLEFEYDRTLTIEADRIVRKFVELAV